MAIKAFYNDKDETPIIVHSPDFEDDEIPVPYLFRSYKEMPEIEQRALDLCYGKVLDVGCGAGSHSLYLQNEKNLEVVPIDTSEGAIEICKKRGLNTPRIQDFFKLKSEKFDTLLMLMNGSGIIGKLDHLNSFFGHARKLLHPDGQILMDSSDLIFLFDEKPEECEEYYGELRYKMSYKNHTSASFNWLYIDPEKLTSFCEKNSFSCEIVFKGTHFDYLAVIKPM